MLPLLPLVTPVIPCYPCYPLLPLLPFVTLCYPCYPLLHSVTPYYPCYPLLPPITPFYPLLPLVTAWYPCYPLALLPPVTSCYQLQSYLLVLHHFKIWLFAAVLTDFPTLVHVESWKKEKENDKRFVERMCNDLKLYPGLNADLFILLMFLNRFSYHLEEQSWSAASHTAIIRPWGYHEFWKERMTISCT